ncbi:hypothetical protein [Brachybacterium phenoliresistens]|uniref:DUF4352 domain-containing protein n=1 Tax=Brachybacterium phenoliresistens TaxID=396014 RepID=Z9JY88_9MICO|nr:hypothetical protein [Brachybacterium phenoliresistens]EWS82963.1 hypothetical protein BF93_05550 [Brachybacterium phenoliresistens]
MSTPRPSDVGGSEPGPGGGSLGPSPQGAPGPTTTGRAGWCLAGACAVMLVGALGLGAAGYGVWTTLRDQETVTSTRPPAAPVTEDPEEAAAVPDPTTDPAATADPVPSPDRDPDPGADEATATEPAVVGAAEVELVVTDVVEVDRIETAAGTVITPENGVLVTVHVDMTNHGGSVIEPSIDAITVRDGDGALHPVRVLSFTTDSAGFAPGATVTLEVTVDVPAGTRIAEVGYTDPELTGGQELIALVP